MASKSLRLFNTVRHLKPVQIYARAAQRLSHIVPDPAPAPPLRPHARPWVPPVSRPASLRADWRVRFLNHEGSIVRPEQWNSPAQSKLWLYNLHYFDDLLAGNGAIRRDQQRQFIHRWIAENSPPAGNGWEPYPVSLRVVNWIKWGLAGEPLDQGMLDSLAMQARWLARQVEWHLLGNHILANAKALIYAGSFFGGAEGDSWLRQGLSILARELPEQILDDGGHFELSPMYHAIILEDFLDLVNVSRRYGLACHPVLHDLPDVAHRMRAWLAAMTHPDGGPAFFNDSAFAIAASCAELEAFAGRLSLAPVAEPGAGVHHLAASGYVRLNVGEMAAILDVAAIGPDYIPGHAHADTLSFELSLGAERVIVNGGTSTYARGPERDAQRATRAHSTVEIDDENSSEVWASFRVARRARITRLGIENGPTVRVTASHDGYRRLSGRNVHTRTWAILDRSLTLFDEVSGPFRSAVARFHLAPNTMAMVQDDGRRGRFTTPDGRAISWQASAPAAVVASRWHPEFGVSVPNNALEIRFNNHRVTTSFKW